MTSEIKNMIINEIKYSGDCKVGQPNPKKNKRIHNETYQG